MPPRHLKPSLEGTQPYEPGLQPADVSDWVKLNTNEAPMEPSPEVEKALLEALKEPLRLYPDPMSRAARRAIAARLGLNPEMVALANGGDEVIAMCFRAFVPAGVSVAYPVPTYPLFEPLCRQHEAVPSEHPLGEDWSLPADFAADPAPLKFLVNPNSPTGTWVDRPAVERVLERSAGVVVLDEAYVDFAPESRLDLVLEGQPDLLILRSFSKAYALAGLRLGYAVGHPDLIESLDVVKDSYNVNRLGIAAAVAAIGDQDHKEALVRFVIEERAWLAGKLRELGFEVAPSATNFLFCRPPAGAGIDVHHQLQQRRVLVLRASAEPGRKPGRPRLSWSGRRGSGRCCPGAPGR
jgi:histidinol-phosphate aminotransferase